MAKEDVIKLSGRVEEILGNSMFRVRLENDHVVTAYIGGKLRMHTIKIILGDEKEAKAVYEAFKQWMTYAILNGEINN